MIYMENPIIDRNNIIRYIDDFFGENDMQSVQVDSSEVYEVCLRMRTLFPHVDGMKKSSAFKKVANFVAHFIEIKPIKAFLPDYTIEGLSSFDINAVIALDIAITCLHKATIMRDDGKIDTIENPIYLSNHSYADIIQSLSFDHITQKTHYHLLAVFFEQMVYKTNRSCEYKDTDSDEPSAFYPELLPGGDDMYGA